MSTKMAVLQIPFIRFCEPTYKNRLFQFTKKKVPVNATDNNSCTDVIYTEHLFV